MHTGVGATGAAHQTRLGIDSAHGAVELARDRSRLRLTSETRKYFPVVSNREQDSERRGGRLVLLRLQIEPPAPPTALCPAAPPWAGGPESSSPLTAVPAGVAHLAAYAALSWACTSGFVL